MSIFADSIYAILTSYFVNIFAFNSYYFAPEDKIILKQRFCNHCGKKPNWKEVIISRFCSNCLKKFKNLNVLNFIIVILFIYKLYSNFFQTNIAILLISLFLSFIVIIDVRLCLIPNKIQVWLFFSILYYLFLNPELVNEQSRFDDLINFDLQKNLRSDHLNKIDLKYFIFFIKNIFFNIFSVIVFIALLMVFLYFGKLINGIGFGDLKLLLTLSPIIGGKNLPIFLILASFLGVITGIIWILKSNRKHFPFAPGIIYGLMFFLGLKSYIIELYYGAFYFLYKIFT